MVWHEWARAHLMLICGPCPSEVQQTFYGASDYIALQQRIAPMKHPLLGMLQSMHLFCTTTKLCTYMVSALAPNADRCRHAPRQTTSIHMRCPAGYMLFKSMIDSGNSCAAGPDTTLEATILAVVRHKLALLIAGTSGAAVPVGRINYDVKKPPSALRMYPCIASAVCPRC